MGTDTYRRYDPGRYNAAEAMCTSGEAPYLSQSKSTYYNSSLNPQEAFDICREPNTNVISTYLKSHDETSSERRINSLVDPRRRCARIEAAFF